MLEPGRARTRQRTSPHFCHLPHQFSPTSPPIMLLAARLSPGSQTQLVQSNRGGAQDFTVPLFPLLLLPHPSPTPFIVSSSFFSSSSSSSESAGCVRDWCVHYLHLCVCFHKNLQNFLNVVLTLTRTFLSFLSLSFAQTHTRITVDRSEKHEHKRVHIHKEGRPHPNIISLPSTVDVSRNNCKHYILILNAETLKFLKTKIMNVYVIE